MKIMIKFSGQKIINVGYTHVIEIVHINQRLTYVTGHEILGPNEVSDQNEFFAFL